MESSNQIRDEIIKILESNGDHVYVLLHYFEDILEAKDKEISELKENAEYWNTLVNIIKKK